MAGNNDALAAKYTNESYVTRQGFFAALGSSLVSRLWDSVESYRLVHSEQTGLRTISGLPFRVTMTEPLKKKYEDFAQKLLQVKEAFDAFPEDSEERESAIRQATYECLKKASDLEKAKVTEPSLKAMANLIYRDPQPGHEGVLGYRDYMRGYIGATSDDPDAFFADVYAAMCGVEELVSFYRLDDPPVPYGQTSYAGFAPHEEIERLMEEFSYFIQYESLDIVEKALLSMYFLVYVDPFVSHNPLMAVVLGKKILQRSFLGDAALLLPLEGALLPNQRQQEMFLEAQKKGDFTYAYLYMIDAVTPALENLLNIFVAIKREAYKKEFASLPQEQKPAEAAPAMVEAPVSEPSHVVEEVEPAPKPVLQEVAKPEPKPAPAPIVLEDEEENPKKKMFEAVPELETIPAASYSVFAPKASLSDKEVKMAARYLMETHPQLNRQQALFFASHSTLGRYYTVQDYKKAMKVAYETARTSMDRLAACKLFKKYRIKNKYVYTPLKPGEKE